MNDLRRRVADQTRRYRNASGHAGGGRPIRLDAPVARYLPEWRRVQPDWRARVTVRHLLTHTSGLPAHQDYFETLKNRRDIVAAAFTEPLAYEPGTQSVYSDLGFILLGEIIERLTGKPLDQLAHERIFVPLGWLTHFYPPKSLRARIAPTENDQRFRKRLIRGEVHDENAWAMGGVAGHAGMFSTAPDLAVFCQMLLNGGIYAHRRLLRRETIARFTAPDDLRQHPDTRMDVPTASSSSGRYFSRSSFGHMGSPALHLGRPGEATLCGAADQSREPHTRQRKDPQVRPAFTTQWSKDWALGAGNATPLPLRYWQFRCHRRRKLARPAIIASRETARPTTAAHRTAQPSFAGPGPNVHPELCAPSIAKTPPCPRRCPRTSGHCARRGRHRTRR